MKYWLSLSFFAFIAVVSVMNPLKGYSAEKDHAGKWVDYTLSELKESDMDELKKAYFAGGCFWCMQPPFDATPGVKQTLVGYTGGTEENPTYHDVGYGKTHHAEAIEVVYDPKEVSYSELVKVFLFNINPVQEGGQFADRGPQYRTEIFYSDATEKAVADSALKDIGERGPFAGQKIAVRVSAAGPFYPAEDYHQKYYQKNYDHYSRYKIGSGRAGFIESYWKPLDSLHTVFRK